MRRSVGFVTTAWPAIGVTAAIVAALIWLLAASGPAGADGDQAHLLLYCAAGMTEPVTKIAEDYKREFGVEVQIEPAGSGTLLSKIRTTRPALRGQVYLAADETYIARARDYGVIAETIPVARIRPVIVVPADNPKNVRSLDDLLRDDVRVVLANPELASVGRVTQQALEKAGVWDAIQRRVAAGGVSFVGTVTEVAGDMRNRSADAGIVWDTVATIFDIGSIDDPAFDGFEQTISVAAVIPNEHPAATLRFMRYLAARDKGLIRFAESGFKPIADADTFVDRGPVLLMAGAMLKPAIEDKVAEFARREGVTVDRVYNGCGILVAQMKTGTQPDAYFSCDVSFMRQVADRFEPATIVSRNPMVLLVRKGNPRQITSLADLAAGGMTIGLAHPTNSALGDLTDKLLAKLNLRDRIDADNYVIHADAGHLLVNQMRVGSLDAAVVYRSNARANPENLEHYDVVELTEPGAVATQPYAVAAAPGHRYLMRRLFDTITDADARRRFDELGFERLGDGAAAP